MLEKMFETYSNTDTQLFVMYDIACTLHSHLKVLILILQDSYHALNIILFCVFLKLTQKKAVLDTVQLCLPTFHSYGHKVSCQVRTVAY